MPALTDSAKAWLQAEKVAFVECLAPDLHGLGKGRTVPADELFDGGVRLPEAIFGQDILGGWCENHDLIKVADVDMLLAPDAQTLVMQPWSAPNAAQCICDCQTLDGAPLNIAPRQLLRHIVGLFNAQGLRPVVAEEAEFHLVERNRDALRPLQPALGVSGRRQRHPRSYQVEALAEFAPFLQRLQEYAKVQNLKVRGLVPEMGCAQLEVNFHHGDALERADEMFLFKRIARQAALEHGCHATFLAKPMTGQPGSAMHVHQSIVDQDSGRNLFADKDGQPSRLFRAYLGGLQKYSPGVMALLAPNVNSYRRFAGAESCPTNLAWGIDNRTTGFRAPRASPEATRIENRIPGADANPYLAIAASLACGWLGLQEKLAPSAPIAGNAWDEPHTLPRSLGESLEALARCEPLVALFGERFVNLFIDVKMRELDAFSTAVTPWEREHLLLTA